MRGRGSGIVEGLSGCRRAWQGVKENLDDVDLERFGSFGRRSLL